VERAVQRLLQTGHGLAGPLLLRPLLKRGDYLLEQAAHSTGTNHGGLLLRDLRDGVTRLKAYCCCESHD
jgi:hypothetical protein